MAFNRFHDQLILTGGSDGRVKLENIFSVSSAATLRVNETAEGADENAAQESDSRCAGAQPGGWGGVRWAFANIGSPV